MIEVGALGRNTERGQGVALRGEVLIVVDTRAYPIFSPVTGTEQAGLWRRGAMHADFNVASLVGTSSGGV